MVTEEQLEALREYRAHFLETGEINKNVRPMVAESWRRSRANGVDPVAEAGDYRYLSDGETKKLLEKYSQLLDVAYPAMLRIIEYIEGTQYAISLHDNEGRVLCHLFAGDNPEFYEASAGFNRGAIWSEKNVGTCAPHLCTSLDRDVMLIGAEHYSAKLCNLACIAAPIHSRSGEVIACVNMMGECKKLTHHTLALVKELALQIQARLRQEEIVSLFKKTSDLMPEGIVILDEHFRVYWVNQKAASILDLPQSSVKNLDFRKVFRKEDFENRLQRERVPFGYPVCSLNVSGKKLLCSVTISPILQNERTEGILITLRLLPKSESVSKQTGGNHASYGFDDIISQDSSILSLKENFKGICNTDYCVLIEGESGTGKELFAQALHSESKRNSGPFIAVNCGSLPRSLVESELFGYDKGAFTGARSEGSPGKFELANGGTLFLDEVGELPLEVQATLLRVLDTHRSRRIGGKTEKELDIRVVAATNRDLYREVQNGNFRSDLYFRLSVLKYDIPPLRARGDDVYLLADRFLDKINRDNAQKKKSFAQDFYDAIGRYSWPGNVRELQNVVARGFYTSQSNIITAMELPHHILNEISRMDSQEKRDSSTVPLQPTSVKEFERLKIIEALEKCGGNVVEAGKLLGFSKSTIYRRLSEYNIRTK